MRRRSASRRGRFVHKGGLADEYLSPFLLEILSSKNQGAWPVATGSLTAEAPGKQVVSCSRAASAYCLGNDGLLHLLGANTVRVEPSGLLREGASTNDYTYSQNLTGGGPNLPWKLFGGVTFVDNFTTAPDGTTTAAQVITPGGTGAPEVYRQDVGWGSGSPAENALSCFAKAGTCTTFAVGSDTATGAGITIDLTNGNVLDTLNLASYSVVAIGNGWYRILATVSSAFGETVYAFGQDATVKGAYRSTNWTTVNGNYGLLWGVQIERKNFCTSYIPTSSTTATRDADSITAGNPLNPSNPSTWRQGCTATPLAAWSVVTAVDGASVLVALGANVTNNDARVLSDGANSGRIYADVTDNTGNARTINSTSVPNNAPGASTQAGLLVSTAGVLTGAPSLDTVTGPGTGTITFQPATFYIGEPGGLTTFGFWGHLTDILVDNT